MGFAQGSGELILLSPRCRGCDPAKPSFNDTASSTSRPIKCSVSQDCDNYSIFGCSGQCTFSISYETCVISNPTQICTMSGVVVTDVAHVGPFPAVPLAIALIETQTPSYKVQEPLGGLVGLAGTSAFHLPILPSALAKAGYVNDAFAFCFTNATNGLFMLGGALPGTFHAASLVWVPLAGGQYQVQLDSIAVGGASIGFQPQPVVLDSGTSNVVFDSATFAAFQQQLAACTSCAHVNSLFSGNCVSLTQAQINAYPPLQFSIGGFTATMAPSAYLFPHSLHGGAICLGISSASGGPILLGDTFFFSLTLIFDRANARMGFANVANCA